jgi:hypothetical protein
MSPYLVKVGKKTAKAMHRSDAISGLPEHVDAGANDFVIHQVGGRSWAARRQIAS